ncbi:hypothetical protein BDN72DRAFT_879313 [Pluteus cervinus]|uniref:Uncharacterized protein n=1 Tax=Pluteus cervinus TaxID=181527 RepID=A0ACD3AQQ8_9AGAR|nr:hypothetical protein BDN72DRAFT_879313 [Pluteus cervinus]
MPDPRLIVPESLTELEREDIVKYFKNIPEAERMETNHFDFVRQKKPTWFVKYGDSDLLDEASTQSFFYTLAQEDGSAPRIPAVYSVFRGEGYYFFVMEKIDMPTLETCDIPETDAVQHVASAVRWLLDQMPLVPKTIFGRISVRNTRVWHRFFKQHEAPVPFVSSEAVSKYVNKALSRRPGQGTISLSDDLAIYHSDIYKRNFLYDVSNVTPRRICIVDFQHIGVLPKPFQAYGFFNIGSSLAADVGNYLGYQPSDIAGALMQASGLLQRCAGMASLGLNELGERGGLGSARILPPSDSPNRYYSTLQPELV